MTGMNKLKIGDTVKSIYEEKLLRDEDLLIIRHGDEPDCFIVKLISGKKFTDFSDVFSATSKDDGSACSYHVNNLRKIQGDWDE